LSKFKKIAQNNVLPRNRKKVFQFYISLFNQQMQMLLTHPLYLLKQKLFSGDADDVHPELISWAKRAFAPHIGGGYQVCITVYRKKTLEFALRANHTECDSHLSRLAVNPVAIAAPSVTFLSPFILFPLALVPIVLSPMVLSPIVLSPPIQGLLTLLAIL
jgi:hypothetical protein